MTPQQLQQAHMLDIVFDGRNKQYGAYELRLHYPQRLNKALAATIVICLLLMLLNTFAFNSNSNPVLQVGPDMYIDPYNEKPKEKEIITQPKKTVQQPKTKQIIYSTPIITTQEIPEDVEPPTVDEVNNTKIGTIAIDGNNGPDIVAPPIEKTGTGHSNNTLPQAIDYEKEFTVVLIEASFTGGPAAWKRYLERNLNKDIASENGAAEGKYSVTVSFRVDKNGVVSDVTAENNPGFGTAEEAVRIIQKSPTWQPANQNGKAVNYRAKQIITFIVSY